MKIWLPVLLKQHKWIACLLAVTVGVNVYLIILVSDRPQMKSKLNKESWIDNSEVTVIIREFEHFSNLLQETSKSALPHACKVVIISDGFIYPPIKFSYSSKIRIISNTKYPEKQHHESLDKLINSEYTLILPDGAKVVAQVLKEATNILKKSDSVRIVAIPVNGYPSVCAHIQFQYKSWTVSYSKVNKICNSVVGKHAILTATKHLLHIRDPLKRPIEQAFYIQSSLHNYQVALLNSTFNTVGQLAENKNVHLKWKRKVTEFERIKALYKDFGVRLIKKLEGTEEWYGCKKTTSRCFGTIVNDMPDYLYSGRWTPPCCLHNLRITATHVLKLLESEGVRYWLEGGSLLGAARMGDIIPWDYDIDIGIYESDIKKSKALSLCKSGPYEDNEGFIWEKGREGKFYRVQFSLSNHLHVDIFPFYSKNGIMTKDTWFKNHRQDREFPEHYLQPRTKIKFIGIEAYAPNKVTDFLEYKFGKGVIEHLKYPDSSSVY